MRTFLPINKDEMLERGWEIPDFVMVTGDAYVDHPSFGAAVISRYLEDKGYKVAILSQPDYKSADDFKEFGRPRLGFLVTSGAVDSMVNNYSVFKKKRFKDVYSSDGRSGKRPDRAVIVYTNRIKEAYKGVPVILGGLEASLRRFAHYDYWDDRVRKSILLDSKADILVYGMGERAIEEVADALNSGFDARDISWVRGTVVRSKDLEKGDIVLPSFDSLASKESFADSFKIQYENSEHHLGKSLLEAYPGDMWIKQNPPQAPLEERDLDYIYSLPYTYSGHPSFGEIPALAEVKFSVTMNRGCFGNCSFCAITYHQGREVRSRSLDSVLSEAKMMTEAPDFKGYIHDLGGPTANFTSPACKKQERQGTCTHKECFDCENLTVNHAKYLKALREMRKLPGIKKVFIRSGIRYDYLLRDSNYRSIIREITDNHVSGLLKVAPEHSQARVLRQMNKPSIDSFEKFAKEFDKANKDLGKDQYLIPYYISSHPASRLEDAYELAKYLKSTGFIPDQVQDFYPTPGTLSTCMYYTGINPIKGEKVYVEKSMEGKKMQRALLHFNKKENRKTVKKALRKLGKNENELIV